MLGGEEYQRQSRSSARALEGKAYTGFGWMQNERSPLGPSRFQVPSSHRNRPLVRKPPEPLRRAVAACLSASHHPNSESVGTLQVYLSNPLTVDLAYSVLLEHANAERDRSPPVVARSISILRRYLVRYVPKHAMLQQVDTFCATLIAECGSTSSKLSLGSTCLQAANELASSRQAGMTSEGATKAAFASVALVKSLTYVRALVARHLPSNLLQSTRIAELSNAYTKRSRALYSAFGPPGMPVPSDDKDPTKSMPVHSLEENEEFIASNVLKWRWMGGKRNQCWTPSPVMTDSGGISRPQVKRLFEYSEMGAGALFMKGSDFKAQKQHGKQAEKSLNSDSIGEQLLQPSKVTTITDGGSMQSHLRAIATSKRQKSPSQVWNPDVPKSTWRRRPRPLFQYKHYSEQQPLRLSNSEIEEVLSAFCAEGAGGGGSTPVVPLLPVVHPGRVSFESADVAGSVLIKLIIDMYMADSLTAAPLTLSMLEGMLGSSSNAVRIRCFDLILNLGIHAHLLEPMQMEEQSALGGESIEASALLASLGAFPSSKRGLNLEEAFRAEERLELMQPQESSGTFKAPIDKVDGATPEAVKIFELWLLQILFEMLLFLVQIRETGESIWAAALSCLLYFVCDGSRIQRHRLHGLDIRVIKNLLDMSWDNAWADELRCTLVCIMSNLLYKVGGTMDGGSGRDAEFDTEQLELLGGIEFACLEFARANSTEAKANLFCIVLDYVLHELNIKHLSAGSSQPSADDIQAVVGALILADCAEVLGFALKYGIKNVGEGLFGTIIAAMSRDVDNGRLNSTLLQEATTLLDALVATFTNPDEEFAEHLFLTMASKEPSDTLDGSSADDAMVLQAWATLNSLLHSSKLSCRLYGYSWLVDLLSGEIAHDSISIFDSSRHEHLPRSSRSKGSNESNEKTEMKPTFLVAIQLLYSLLKSREAVIRRGFILVLERLLVSCQNLAVNNSLIQLSEGEGIGDVSRRLSAEHWENKILALMNGVLLQFVSANDTNHINILQMCNVVFTQLCITLPRPFSHVNPSNTFIKDNMVFNRIGNYYNMTNRIFSTYSNSGKLDSKQFRSGMADYRGYGRNTLQSSQPVSLAAMLLKGQAAAPKLLVASIPTHLLYWPLLQLAGSATEDMTLGVAVGSQGRGCTSGGASDVRIALLVLLIGKCSVQQSAFEEVGGEEFFRSLLDDMDARVAYYTASFLLKRMMSEEPEKYQRVLHTLVFRAQQCNNEKLLENPYLQMRGIMQLSNDPGGLVTIHEA